MASNILPCCSPEDSRTTRSTTHTWRCFGWHDNLRCSLPCFVVLCGLVLLDPSGICRLVTWPHPLLTASFPWACIASFSRPPVICSFFSWQGGGGRVLVSLSSVSSDLNYLVIFGSPLLLCSFFGSLSCSLSFVLSLLIICFVCLDFPWCPLFSFLGFPTLEFGWISRVIFLLLFVLSWSWASINISSFIYVLHCLLCSHRSPLMSFVPFFSILLLYCLVSSDFLFYLLSFLLAFFFSPIRRVVSCLVF